MRLTGLSILIALASCRHINARVGGASTDESGASLDAQSLTHYPLITHQEHRELQGNSGNGANLIDVMIKFKNDDGKRAAENAASYVKGYISRINVVGIRVPEAAIKGLSNNPNVE
jgi:hypothetical protein